MNVKYILERIDAITTELQELRHIIEVNDSVVTMTVGEFIQKNLGTLSVRSLNVIKAMVENDRERFDERMFDILPVKQGRDEVRNALAHCRQCGKKTADEIIDAMEKEGLFA